MDVRVLHRMPIDAPHCRHQTLEWCKNRAWGGKRRARHQSEHMQNRRAKASLAGTLCRWGRPPKSRMIGDPTTRLHRWRSHEYQSRRKYCRVSEVGKRKGDLCELGESSCTKRRKLCENRTEKVVKDHLSNVEREVQFEILLTKVALFTIPTSKIRIRITLTKMVLPQPSSLLDTGVGSDWVSEDYWKPQWKCPIKSREYPSFTSTIKELIKI